MKLSEEIKEDIEKIGFTNYSNNLLKTQKSYRERLKRTILPKVEQFEQTQNELIEIIEMKLNAECMLCKKDIKEDINGCLENCLNNDFRKKLLNIKDGK